MQTLRSIFQLRVTLAHVEPPIWRRILVLSSTELAGLHQILQAAMGWKNCHLHQFIAGQRRYGTPDPDFPDGTTDESGIRIGSLLKAAGDQLQYEYDFGDGWLHEIVLEEVLPFAPGSIVPLCIAAQRSCPPEDVGGPPGYQDFLVIFQNKTHPDYKAARRWAGNFFRPEAFDAGAVNGKLGRLKLGSAGG